MARTLPRLQPAARPSSRGDYEEPFVLPRRAAGTGMVAYGSLMALAILLLQVIRSATIDANSLSGTSVDLLGYLAVIAFGAIIFPPALARDRIQFPLLWLSIVLVLYVAVNALITRPELPTIPLLASRFGILLWLFVGMSAGLALTELRNVRNNRGANVLRTVGLGVIAITMAYGFYFSISYINSPVETMNYQMVANSAMTAMVLMMLLIEALWGKNKPLILGIIFVAWGSVLTLAVAFTQSNSIIAFWIGTLIIYFYSTVKAIGIFRGFIILMLLSISFWFLLQSELFERLVRSTRLFELFYGTSNFSSVTSRLEIIKTFPDQFAVGPIFGNFAAEFHAGVGEGFYPHSLLLSFLTHTGLAGTALWIGTLVIAHVSYARGFGNDVGSKAKLRLFWLTIIYGSLATFLTWSMLWFMLGIMCVRPSKFTAGDKR